MDKREVRLPDITLVQIVAALGWVVTQAIAMGFLDNDQGQVVVQIGSSVLAAAWMIGEAVIRNGRARALAPGSLVPGAPSIIETPTSGSTQPAGTAPTTAGTTTAKR